jgi:hypothetical protein
MKINAQVDVSRLIDATWWDPVGLLASRLIRV